MLYNANELGYISNIVIIDNGEGITFTTLQESFGNFLDSTKRKIPKRTSYTRGRKGKGRFSFSLFATHACWDTRFQDQDGHVKEYPLKIDQKYKETFDTSDPIRTQQPTGTRVSLEGVFGLSAAELAASDFHIFLASEFGWFLLLNQEQGLQILINQMPLDYRQIMDESEHLEWTIAGSDEQEYVFSADYVRWNHNIGDRYYAYFLNHESIEAAKQLSSFNNNAIGFHHSVFIQSRFFNDFFSTDMSLAQENNLFSEREQQGIRPTNYMFNF